MFSNVRTCLAVEEGAIGNFASEMLSSGNDRYRGSGRCRGRQRPRAATGRYRDSPGTAELASPVRACPIDTHLQAGTAHRPSSDCSVQVPVFRVHPSTGDVSSPVDERCTICTLIRMYFL